MRETPPYTALDSPALPSCDSAGSAGAHLDRTRPNGLELTGAGLAPRCNNSKRNAGVRCSDVLGRRHLLCGCWAWRLAPTATTRRCGLSVMRLRVPDRSRAPRPASRTLQLRPRTSPSDRAVPDDANVTPRGRSRQGVTRAGLTACGSPARAPWPRTMRDRHADGPATLPRASGAAAG
jgi:hypothetical protein